MSHTWQRAKTHRFTSVRMKESRTSTPSYRVSDHWSSGWMDFKLKLHFSGDTKNKNPFSSQIQQHRALLDYHSCTSFATRKSVSLFFQKNKLHCLLLKKKIQFPEKIIKMCYSTTKDCWKLNIRSCIECKLRSITQCSHSQSERCRLCCGVHDVTVVKQALGCVIGKVPARESPRCKLSHWPPFLCEQGPQAVILKQSIMIQSAILEIMLHF